MTKRKLASKASAGAVATKGKRQKWVVRSPADEAGPEVAQDAVDAMVDRLMQWAGMAISDDPGLRAAGQKHLRGAAADIVSHRMRSHKAGTKGGRPAGPEADASGAPLLSDRQVKRRT